VLGLDLLRILDFVEFLPCVAPAKILCKSDLRFSKCVNESAVHRLSVVVVFVSVSVVLQCYCVHALVNFVVFRSTIERFLAYFREVRLLAPDEYNFWGPAPNLLSLLLLPLAEQEL